MKRICIASVDATRARLYTFEEMAAPPGEITQQLRERIDLCHPARRLRPSELFADSRPGADRAPNGRNYLVDDHREASMRHMDHQFAGLVVEELERLVAEEGTREVILAASPRMLGLLRELTAPLRERGVSVCDIDRDLVKLSRSQLHDYLSRRDLLPERERLAARA
jgi:protein required for attachment to host cells